MRLLIKAKHVCPACHREGPSEDFVRIWNGEFFCKPCYGAWVRSHT